MVCACVCVCVFVRWEDNCPESLLSCCFLGSGNWTWITRPVHQLPLPAKPSRHPSTLWLITQKSLCACKCFSGLSYVSRKASGGHLCNLCVHCLLPEPRAAAMCGSSSVDRHSTIWNWDNIPWHKYMVLKICLSLLWLSIHSNLFSESPTFQGSGNTKEER